MKKGNKTIKVVLGAIFVIIISACIIIQVVISNDNKKLEKESKKYETLTTQTKSGEQIETEYIHIEENEFYVKIPKTFKQLDYETINKKYNGDVPNIVFSNDETTVNIAISITQNEMKNEQIETYKEYMEKILKNNSEIISSNYYKEEKHNIGQIKLMSQAVDTKIYNNMIFFSYNDKLVIIAFNCTEELKEEWQNVGDFITDSLFFKNN